MFGQHSFLMLQLPLMGKQLYEFLMCGLLMIGHSGNDVIQVISCIHVVCLAGSQQVTDYRYVDSRLVVAAEEVILPSLCCTLHMRPSVMGRMTFSARLLSHSKRPSSRHLIILSHRV